MNEIICMVLISVVVLIFIGLVCLWRKIGPGMINYIKSFIRFNKNRK